MCGIAGYAALDPRQALDPGPVRAMLDQLAHRGPDDEGTHVRDGVVLGHRRLSVIDLDGGHQPLFGATERTAIVANGEIYNYRILRRELEDLGHRFHTASDTEVAAHAYDAWELDFLDRLDGMFALALWDGARRRLVLARDRMGEKPLYYFVRDGVLAFASELDALLAWPGCERRISPTALVQYLTLEYVPAPDCMIADVAKLEPGMMLVAEHGDVDTRPYWRIDPRPTARMPYPDAVRELRGRLERAVRSRLVSDVPLGIFLSGGIDSSTVAALAAREGALETFAIGFDEASFDERRYARAVAERIGSRHHEYVVRAEEMPNLVPRLGELLDEPLGDASILPTAVLSRFAREHVTVALGGDGGDELFAGYPMHAAQRIASLARMFPAPLHRAFARGASWLPVSHANFSLGFRIRSFLRGAAAPPPDNHALWMSSFSVDELADLLEPGLLEMATVGHDALNRFRSIWAASAGAPLLARATHLDARTYLPNDILTKVDRASMAVALEVRAPFLAREVVEFAFSLPDAYRMRGLRGKRILRDAVRDLLPAQVLGRPKKGFGMPVAAWLNGPLEPLLHDLLGAERLRAGGIFRPATVERMIREHREGRADRRKPLWTLLVFELWREYHGIPATLAAVEPQAVLSA